MELFIILQTLLVCSSTYQAVEPWVKTHPNIDRRILRAKTRLTIASVSLLIDVGTICLLVAAGFAWDTKKYLLVAGFDIVVLICYIAAIAVSIGELVRLNHLKECQ